MARAEFLALVLVLLQAADVGGPVGKAPVFGMRERGKGGRTLAMVTTDMNLEAIRDAVYKNVEMGSHIHTDDSPLYDGVGELFYRHDSINHTMRQYRRGNVTTNGIESVFAVLKRGIIGVYHQLSVKHLGRYVQEATFRLNEGNVANKTVDRIDSFIAGVSGKRLTYEALIA